MPVLYRKYRPQTFASVVGQAPIVQTLRNAVRTGSVAHAYLFTGSRGVGKTSVARILAKAVNCLRPKDGDADGKCEICLAIADNNFLDLIEIDAASNTGVENVRELIEHVKFKPSRAKYKVFIIDEVHMLSKAAFNALLKTLEEPPEHAIFILATTDVQKVPATIISRTQRFDFQRITETEILEQLRYIAQQEQLALDEEVLSLITTNAQGSLRDALSLMDKLGVVGAEITLVEAQSLLGVTSLKLSEQLVSLVARKEVTALPALFDQLLANATDFAALNRDLLEYLRKVLVYKVAGEKVELDLLPEDYKALQQTAGEFTLPELLHLIRLFLRAYKELASSPSAELPLLIAAVEAAAKAEPRIEQPVPNNVPSLARQSSAPRPDADLTVERAEQLDPVSPEEVTSLWPELINKIKALNSPLATLLKNSPVQEVKDGTITIGVKYLFHKENVESKKNYALIASTITELCGKRVRLSAQIIKQPEVVPLSGSVDALGDALKIFGGELVE